LTQEELAEKLYVSRTAISKWESGRGVPNIDSLKAISKFFSVSIDQLLSGEELLAIAENDRKQKTAYMQDLIFGLTDCGYSLLLLIPLFGQTVNGQTQHVAIFQLTQLQPWLCGLFIANVAIVVALGVLTLALQNCYSVFWNRFKAPASVFLSALSACLFIICRQPYAAELVFLFLMIKVLFLLKR
jgi:transcriptional regulator with XRE-family HTH domain